MALVEFVDNQPPYLNAENLNNNFNELDNKIDGIIESGSNENGNYIKYSDGTMICYSIFPLPTEHKNFNTAYGNVYYSGDSEVWTYPQEFYSAPTVLVSAYFQGGLGGGATIRTKPSTTFCQVYPYYSLSYNFSDSTVELNFIAIGKWK